MTKMVDYTSMPGYPRIQESTRGGFLLLCKQLPTLTCLRNQAHVYTITRGKQGLLPGKEAIKSR